MAHSPLRDMSILIVVQAWVALPHRWLLQDMASRKSTYTSLLRISALLVPEFNLPRIWHGSLIDLVSGKRSRRKLST